MPVLFTRFLLLCGREFGAKVTIEFKRSIMLHGTNFLRPNESIEYKLERMTNSSLCMVMLPFMFSNNNTDEKKLHLYLPSANDLSHANKFVRFTIV